MTAKKDRSLSPITLKARNEILVEFGDHTFDHALDEAKSLLETEKNSSTRLALLAAKSWIIRNKVYAMMNEPFVYSLNELENTNIFSGSEEDLGGDLDGLFDDDVDVDDEEDSLDEEDTVELSSLLSSMDSFAIVLISILILCRTRCRGITRNSRVMTQNNPCVFIDLSQ